VANPIACSQKALHFFLLLWPSTPRILCLALCTPAAHLGMQHLPQSPFAHREAADCLQIVHSDMMSGHKAVAVR
jgi:hypothetical protein